jgi:hypothetical protein
MEYFKQKCRRNRFFGDATSKPIDFENSEGNLELQMLEHLSAKLPCQDYNVI